MLPGKLGSLALERAHRAGGRPCEHPVDREPGPQEKVQRALDPTLDRGRVESSTASVGRRGIAAGSGFESLDLRLVRQRAQLHAQVPAR